MTQSGRWKQRPEGSTWGDFGPDDQLGRLNLITPEKVRQGAAEIREGLAFCLSLPLEYPGGNVLNPRRFPPVLRPTRRGDAVNMNYQLGRDHAGATDVLCDDLVLLHLQYSTQWDSFAHVGSMFDADGDGVPEPLYYNGFRAGEDVVGPRDLTDAGAPEGYGPSTSGARRGHPAERRHFRQQNGSDFHQAPAEIRQIPCAGRPCRRVQSPPGLSPGSASAGHSR